jgi:hypothetical protein
VPEQLRLEEVVGDRTAVDRDEHFLRPVPEEMDRRAISSFRFRSPSIRTLARLFATFATTARISCICMEFPEDSGFKTDSSASSFR